MLIFFTEKVNKITLSANANKRIQTPNGAILYPCHTSPGVVCREKSMRHPKIKN